MARTSSPPRVTPRRPVPQALAPLSLSRPDRARVHMLASLLLDYPDATWFDRLAQLRAPIDGLPAAVGELFRSFVHAAETSGPEAWQRAYVATFDLKRKCSLYLTYYATGDTRRRGTALVSFLDAYRAAGWEFDAAELPDYLPAVLEFSARSDSPIAREILSAHREGVEVLRFALESMDSPWAGLIRAVSLSLPAIDDRTRERYLTLINEGPPAEMVGLSFLGNLAPFSPRASREDT